MGLRDLVYTARKNTPPKNGSAQSITKMIGDDNQSTNKIAPVQKIRWEDCKYLKKTANHCLCTKFSVFCAREKCNQKYMK